jgi:uroporphyrinogen decarboxylase
LVGTQELILATYDDPTWVHELLSNLSQRKAGFIRSLAGARYDIQELGGGDASTTVISPRIFEKFVAPYDAALISAAHEIGQRVVYHTCGGMMPILEQIAAMEPDAMETFTPRNMGGDVDLVKAKHRISDKVCMLGGFDQFHFLSAARPSRLGLKCAAASMRPAGVEDSSSAHRITFSMLIQHSFRLSRMKLGIASMVADLI